METVALFTYGSGCTPKHSGGKPSALTQPCLANTGCGLANNANARANATLANTIYKVTPTLVDDEKHITQNNTLTANPRTATSPLHSPADMATSPSKTSNGSDKCDTIYGTLRKEMPTLKAVPPPTIPPSSITPTQTPMLSTRSKKTVTICDSADVGRAISPLSPERI